ncbi:MAG: UbiH/UbiF/VisC/COQ6 family ubiquinone biosynthesis hydroxylase [Alphaproteobacteria bacterium]
MTQNYDVAIIGGGLAGLTLACLLGNGGLRVGIIDAADPQKPMRGDERTTAISYGSALILQQAGIWEDLNGRGAPIRDIKILDGDSALLLQFLSEEVGNKDFGTIFLNSDIRAALNNNVKASENIDLIAPAKVSDFKVDKDGILTILEDARIIHSKLAIGADGRNSFMREWLDIDTRAWSYNQRAVVCIARHENPHHNVAVEHFMPDGPFAILPMADDEEGNHRSSIVFTEHGPERKSRMRLSQEEFVSLLQKRFPADYGTIEMAGERSVYPLSLVHAASYIGPRMALVADAAHGIHPIAGQGLNLGFRDVKEIAALVLKAHKAGQDIGSADLLKTYQRRRRPDNMAMVAFTDGLVRLFSNNLPPLKLARRLGLKAVGKIPLAKRFFMKQAMADRS